MEISSVKSCCSHRQTLSSVTTTRILLSHDSNGYSSDFTLARESMAYDRRVGARKKLTRFVRDCDLDRSYCKDKTDIHAYRMRQRVKTTLRDYRNAVAQLKKENERKSKLERDNSVYKTVAKHFKKQSKWLNSMKRLGEVPGIKVGDVFNSRAEMNVVGLHCRFDDGIDYVNYDGIVATSIVESARYDNFVSDDVIIYSGFGGNPSVNMQRKSLDQKLERGNLALKNSMIRRTPVRFIRKDRSTSQFRYLGLHYVHDYKQSLGPEGNVVFKFLLRKKIDQPRGQTSGRKRTSTKHVG